ncbi:MAG: 30S ribosomal protein S17 [Methanonatronarchaeales archaeon]|nr:30S ribosomal protein S17 [Methanonatronarchaeales archaeon]
MTGLDVEGPEQTCEDANCPFHGTLPVRGQVLEGEVVSKPTPETVIVGRERTERIPKYERYEKRRSRTPAHLSPCLDAEVGDRVRVGECRRLSKTKSFVTVEVLD